MKTQLQTLAAFVILIIGITAIILLTGAISNQLIKAGTYLFWLVVSAIALYLDAKWIDKHFIDGEWV